MITIYSVNLTTWIVEMRRREISKTPPGSILPEVRYLVVVLCTMYSLYCVLLTLLVGPGIGYSRHILCLHTLTSG